MTAVRGVAGSDPILKIMQRWVQEGDINVTAEDIRAIKVELERSIAEFMKSRQSG